MYKTIINQASFQQLKDYKRRIEQGEKPGRFLEQQLANHAVEQLNDEEFFRLLLQTKIPCVFAESAVYGDGRDWNLTELGLLGDTSVICEVQAFDDGLHRSPNVHTIPIDITLAFVPGALLEARRDSLPADWKEVVHGSRLCEVSLLSLYRRRLIPVLSHCNTMAKLANKKALITIPGLGCGQFAGPFRGQLGVALEKILATILNEHHEHWPYIDTVYYDPYNESVPSKVQIGHVHFIVNPYLKSSRPVAQLSNLDSFDLGTRESRDFKLFSLVAWDHVSWPGNDFFSGSRATDDGVKGAATNLMKHLTGEEGCYDSFAFKYRPPKGFVTWSELVQEKGLVFDGGELVVSRKS